MRRTFPLVLTSFLVAAGCAHPEPAPPAAPTTLTAATCPCASGASEHGGMHGGCSGMDGSRMGGSRMDGSMMQGRTMGGSMIGDGGEAPPLTADAKAALLRALDDEYRAEALYAHLVRTLGTKQPAAAITRAEHRHAWILESLALAHGMELPPNAWARAKQPDVATVAAACRAGVESETKTIAVYDDLANIDLPPDLRRAFTHLRAASAEQHRPAFEACR